MATFRSRGMVDELQDMMVERMVADMTATSRSAASTRSGGSANMVSPKATRPASRSWSMCRAGPSATTRRRLLRRCSTRSRWASMRPHRSCATRASTVAVLPVDVNHSAWDCTLERKEEEEVSRRGAEKQGRRGDEERPRRRTPYRTAR